MKKNILITLLSGITLICCKKDYHQMKVEKDFTGT